MMKLSLGILLLFCGFIAAADPPAPTVDFWIDQLTSDDWKTRQKAMEQLIARGDDALPRLQKLLQTSNDTEIRTRASTAIAQIEENRLIGPSPITLDLKDVPPAQALERILQQARAPLLTDPPNLLTAKNLKPVSLNVDHRPFWEVVQTVCARAGLEMAPISRHNHEIGMGVIQSGAEWLDKPLVVSGPLLIRADRLARISTIRLKPPQETLEEFEISLTVFAEPKLRVLDFSSSVKLEEVVDELGHSLIPPTEEGDVAANADVFGTGHNAHTSRWEVGATLHHPKGSGTKIAKFRGSTRLQVQTRAATLEAPLSSASGMTRTLDGLRVAVKTADNAKCALSVFREGRSDLEWYLVRLQLTAGRARLLDEQGQVIARGQPAPDMEESPDNQRIDLRQKFTRESEAKKRPSEATKLEWEFPTQIRELSVPFMLTDLPIP
jgi:hypothetical protein